MITIEQLSHELQQRLEHATREESRLERAASTQGPDAAFQRAVAANRHGQREAIQELINWLECEQAPEQLQGELTRHIAHAQRETYRWECTARATDSAFKTTVATNRRGQWMALSQLADWVSVELARS